MFDQDFRIAALEFFVRLFEYSARAVRGGSPMNGGVLFVALGMVLALMIGTGVERARQAHDHWLSYRARAVRNLTLEMREGVRTVFWLVALVVVIYFAIRLR